MDTRQARILEHVRALSLRDNVGPDSFPIAATGAAQEPEDSSPDEEPLFAEDSFDEGTGESAIIDGPSSSDEGSSRTRRTRSTRESRPVTSRKRRGRSRQKPQNPTPARSAASNCPPRTSFISRPSSYPPCVRPSTSSTRAMTCFRPTGTSGIRNGPPSTHFFTV